MASTDANAPQQPAEKSAPRNEQPDQLTGSLITLITNAQVRYEGTLVNIDRVERSMNLKNVKSFGTEGRRDGVNEIPPHENTIPQVVFKVDHVKDFKIIKRPEKALPQKPQLESQDPAIISAQAQQQASQTQKDPQPKPRDQAEEQLPSDG